MRVAVSVSSCCPWPAFWTEWIRVSCVISSRREVLSVWSTVWAVSPYAPSKETMHRHVNRCAAVLHMCPCASRCQKWFVIVGWGKKWWKKKKTIRQATKKEMSNADEFGFVAPCSYSLCLVSRTNIQILHLLILSEPTDRASSHPWVKKRRWNKETSGGTWNHFCFWTQFYCFWTVITKQRQTAAHKSIKWHSCMHKKNM